MDQVTTSDAELTASEINPITAQRAFSMAMVISGIRCILAYVLLPFAIPLLGLAPGVGPWLGIGIGLVAIGANLFSIRRFARSRHRLRKPVIAIHVTVIVLLVVLIALDVSDVVG